MNTDIRDLPKLLKIKDPRSVWAVLSLVVAMAAFAIVARMLVMSTIQRDMLREDVNATRARIAQVQATQGVDPEALRQRIAERRAALHEVLAGLPTTQQVDDEIGRYYQYANELGAQLVRMEAIANAPEAASLSAYREQRFLLGLRGELPRLLRFLGRISNVPYRGVIVDNIAIGPDVADGATDAVASADLAMFAAHVALDTTPIPIQEVVSPAPTAIVGQSDNISELEALMRRAMADQDWATAVAHGRHILLLDPSRQEIVQTLYHAHLNWGRALAAAGRVAEAQQQYNEALMLMPNGQEAQEGLAALATPTPGPAGAIPKASPIAALPQSTAPAPSPLPTPTGPAGGFTYTVTFGDTLSSVAARHGTTVPALMQANNLASSVIYPGQQLVIPSP